ncbi:MAG: ATP-binding protein, partial [Terriglobales bacterium]
TEVNRVSALVSRFLDFARPSQLDLRPAQVPEVVEKSIKAAEEQGATPAVKIVREYATNLPDVMLDEGLCEQAFLNLVLNACQAMGESGGELRIRIRPAEANGHDQVVVEIEDSGPGVPADMKEQIFNPFVTTKKEGVGLGLAIVSKIIDAHGGSVQLIARQQQPGACFRVVIPVSGPVAGTATGATPGPVSGPVAGAVTGATTAPVAGQAAGTTPGSSSGQATGQSESASGHPDS